MDATTKSSSALVKAGACLAFIQAIGVTLEQTVQGSDLRLQLLTKRSSKILYLKVLSSLPSTMDRCELVQKGYFSCGTYDWAGDVAGTGAHQ